jgi:hypothetical protein
VLSGLGRLFFRSPIGDFHCGMRAFRRSSLLALNPRTTGMEFASEVAVKATLAHQTILEVPTTLSPDGRDRPPHLRTWRDGWRHLRFLLLYSPRWLFLYPGLALMALGLAFGTALMFGPLTVGAVRLDTNSLIYAAAIVIIGFQAVMFAALARAFAMVEGLLPPSAHIEALFRRVSLEKGLAAGAALLLVGIGVSAYVLVRSGAGQFGALDTASVRLVVPAATAMVLGLETILVSFFFSLLGLHRR